MSLSNDGSENALQAFVVEERVRWMFHELMRSGGTTKTNLVVPGRSFMSYGTGYLYFDSCMKMCMLARSFLYL